MPDFVVVLTSLPGDFDAQTLAEALVEARAAACVTVLPSARSTYRWDGRVERDEEQQLIVKTTRDRVPDLWRELRARHPYDVPEFLVMSVAEGNPAYLDWVAKAVEPPV